MKNPSDRPLRWSRLVATEEAFAFPEYFDAVGALPRGGVDDLDLGALAMIASDDPDELETRSCLLALGADRLTLMDRCGIDVAVLSLVSPGVQIFDPETATRLARLANDRLAAACQSSRGRLAGLATFDPQTPAGAAIEIERAVAELGLSGVLVNSHTGGEYLDHPRYAPILETITSLDVPLYLHPRNPPAELSRFLTPHEGPRMTEVLWGFQMETSLHLMRLVVGGVFDRFPTLRVVVGHLGEGLPSLLWRLDWAAEGRLARSPSDVFRANIWVTTSGIFSHPMVDPTLAYTVDLLGAERILFATDHPFADPVDAVRALATSTLPDGDLERIARTNAERVFRLAPARAESTSSGGPG